jgi:nucleoside diphosphate kinase
MQNEQLSYAIITPYSMRKSRTGGIISRLISRTGLDLVAARMFAPSTELVRQYAETVVTETEPRHRATQELIRDYVLKNFSAETNGQRARVLFLVFRGEDAIQKMRDTVGHIVHERTSGETIRDTFGDYIADDAGKATYFEPGVLAAFEPSAVERDLKLWAEFSDRDGGILDRAVQFPTDAKIEKTLVLIKPDNFKFPNLRPGGVIEVFSRTGLYIVGFKVHRMSVAQAEEFYGPVLPVLQEKLGHTKGREAWEDIVQFMSGARPSDTLPEKRGAPGSEKCIALVYQGEDAVRKIREVLGPTDPAKAPPGSIRKEFGQTIMINAAHASDSAENAKREMGIVRVDENNFKPLIENFYRRQ